MPAQFTKHFVQDLQQDIKIRQCGTIVFNADNLSNVITVDLYNGTEPYSGGGTVAGAVICPDGATVALDNGTLTGNVASVTLKADCFAIPGQIGVGVQVISGSIRTTVLKAIYNVELLSTDDMVDPDSRITASVTQLVADIEAATAEIPASDMASLMSGIAPTFSTSTNYAAGAYVYYSGTLYRFTNAHAAGSWTGTDATQVALGNDLGNQVSDLKSAVIQFVADCPASGFNINELTQNGIWTIRTSRKSVCTNLPDGTIGALTLVTQHTTNNTSWQRLYDANGSIWARTVNTTTFVPITNWSNNIVQESGTGTSVSMSQKATTDALALKADQTVVNGKADQTVVNGKADQTVVDELIEEFIESKTIPNQFYSSKNKCILKNCANLDKVFITNKNIIPVLGTTSTSNGITKTVNSDGSISLSGTSTGTATFSVSAGDMPPIKDGNFVMSLKNSLTCGDDDTYLQLSINSNYSANYICRFKDQNASIAFKLAENEVVTGYRIRVSSGVTFPEGFKIYPQIEEGTAETAFVKNETKSFTPTTADTDDVDCFVGYNYIASNMTGNVEYIISLEHELDKYTNYTSKLKGKTIVCFGDSITGNYPAPNDYPSMLAEATGATVYNAGFGGCCMADNHLVDASQTRYLFTMCRLADSIAAGDFSAQANSGVSITYKQGGANVNYVPARVAMLSAIDWSKVDFITISYGTNDWNSNYGLDNENDPDDTTTYIGAFRYSVEKILTAYPNIKILPITPLWRYWDSDTGLPSGQTGDYLDANTYAKGTGYYLWNYGDALIEAAEEYHIPVLDMYHNCMMNKFNRHQYFNVTDGTHPKYEGRKLFAEILVGALESKY